MEGAGRRSTHSRAKCLRVRVALVQNVYSSVCGSDGNAIAAPWGAVRQNPSQDRARTISVRNSCEGGVTRPASCRGGPIGGIECSEAHGKIGVIVHRHSELLPCIDNANRSMLKNRFPRARVRCSGIKGCSRLQGNFRAHMKRFKSWCRATGCLGDSLWTETQTCTQGGTGRQV